MIAIVLNKVGIKMSECPVCKSKISLLDRFVYTPLRGIECTQCHSILKMKMTRYLLSWGIGIPGILLIALISSHQSNELLYIFPLLFILYGLRVLVTAELLVHWRSPRM